MRRKIMMLCLLATMICSGMNGQNVIPKPAEMSVKSELAGYEIPSKIVVCYDSEETKILAEYLVEELGRLNTVKDARVSSKWRLLDFFKTHKVFLYIDKLNGVPKEGYRLTVSEKRIEISASDYGGLFNGVISLLQLFPVENNNLDCVAGMRTIPALEIVDYPRFEYRGMHLDVARTFSTKEEVMRFIDNISRYKINKFHWHLTDDEGWRIEIKSHPELAKVGGFRGGDSPIMPVYGEWDKKYGGYYTQEEVREVVEYAALRNVEIIPEIDLPGHSRTAGKVYPHILCNTKPNTAASGGYDRRDVWCVAKERNYEILEDIIAELAELFPSKYIHIGGDEVDMSQWLACPDCKALMKSEGLADGKELQGYFMNRLVGVVEKHGKRAGVWNEAVNSGTLDKNVLVYGWENVGTCVNATSKGYRTVVMPGSNFYFDMKYAKDEVGMAWAGIVPLEKVYSFDFAEFGEEQMANVAGVEGAFWAELFLSNGKDYLDRQCFPRICALSEIAWTPQELRDFDDFSARLEEHYSLMDLWGIKYRVEPVAMPAETLLRPTVTVTSSMRARSKNPYSSLERYRYGSTARTTRTCMKGDYLQYTFEEPVVCRSMEFATGYTYLPRCIIIDGYAEVMYEDARQFERYGDLVGGRIVIEPARPVKAVKLVAASGPNGETSVIFQVPRIVAK